MVYIFIIELALRGFQPVCYGALAPCLLARYRFRIDIYKHTPTSVADIPFFLYLFTYPSYKLLSDVAYTSLK